MVSCAMTRRMKPTSKHRDELAIVLTYEPAGRWWVAEIPSFPCAYSQGRTPATARKNVLAAMRDLIETYRLQGEPVPAARQVRIEYVAA